MREVIVGSEALRQGKLSRYQLRTRYRAIYPDVYLAADTPLTLRRRSEAAWLWSGQRGVLAGLAAAALHGSNWIDDDEPVELIWRTPSPPAGVITRNWRLDRDEVTRVAGLPVTTPARTAFDLGRQLPAAAAVARLDALMRATPFSVEEGLLIAKRHPGGRGIRQVKKVLLRVDPGAASPKETWLRLLLIDAGLPTPQTQIPLVANYRTVALLDMGWERFKVAAEYDGDQHRTVRRQYVHDIRRQKALEELGWVVIRVIAEDHPEHISRKVFEALHRRGYRQPAGPR
ncbi:hypothetical protein MSIMFI_02400 [Mycobacterium simulans]|uniref:endonuclease domain-containing protein n=1 Tax=Mycobacterium simulans TaxID=627089 RepID=UPI00174DC329|nr:DUF559 domain-containing protein [Mycobacterium simulans]SON60899.1 hypothetical protein MSIMFI_02400 [Mycobacterium simulans]